MPAPPAPPASPRRPPRAGAPALVALCLAVAVGAARADIGAGPAVAARAAPTLVEGDILVGPRLATRGVGLPGESRRWPHGEVPFLLEANLGTNALAAIGAAVAHWNAVSGITLVPITTDDTVPTDRLVFQDGPGCASWVGRQGGAQEVWVGEACTAGSVMHEIGHALGLEHEHTRADRDEHVIVHWDRIVPEKRHNFALAPADARLLGPYDLDSIMHYAPDNFSRDGRATLEPIARSRGARMGQREAPSAGDIAAVARLYASDLALVTRFDDPQAATEVTLFVTNDHPQGAHELELVLSAPGLALAAPTSGDWRCAADGAAADGAGRLRCRLARLAGNAESRVVLSLLLPVAAETLRVTLDSKTPDLDRANNGGPLAGGARAGVPAVGAARTILADAVFADERIAESTAGPAGADEGGGAAAGGGLLPLLLVAALRRRRRGRY